VISYKFWMVVCVDLEYLDERKNVRIQKHGTPTFEHDTRDKAETEALRLAKKNGKQYAVLEVVSKTKPLPAPYVNEYRMADVA
jgi:hypothetical protein